ncbi:hypothetical protein DM790_18920 [Flavobacterium collinsii]|nr:hypothetical protein [Flavobacterium collinsii]
MEIFLFSGIRETKKNGSLSKRKKSVKKRVIQDDLIYVYSKTNQLQNNLKKHLSSIFIQHGQ